jgi:hypothetical protein
MVMINGITRGITRIASNFGAHSVKFWKVAIYLRSDGRQNAKC